MVGVGLGGGEGLEEDVLAGVVCAGLAGAVCVAIVVRFGRMGCEGWAGGRTDTGQCYTQGKGTGCVNALTVTTTRWGPPIAVSMRHGRSIRQSVENVMRAAMSSGALSSAEAKVASTYKQTFDGGRTLMT